LTKRLSTDSAAEIVDAISPELSILVIEDEPGDYRLIDVCLRQTTFHDGHGGSPIVWATNLAAGIAAARDKEPAVVLLDLSLPDSKGIATVQAMIAALPDVPVVVLTGQNDNRLAMAALEAGAQDFLVKGQFDCHALERALRYAQVRAKLESRLRLFEVALNSAANGVVIADIDGRIQWANQAFSEMTGFSLAEVVGHNPNELVKSGKQDETFYRQMWHTILSGQPWSGEIVNRRKDGSFYDEMLAIAPVTMRDGTIRNFVAIKQDITERKLAEKRLLQSEERLEFALSGSDLGIWDIDLVVGNLAASARWHDMLGYRVDEIELTLTGWKQLTHPDDLTQARDSFYAHLRGETPIYEHEYRMRHKNGHWIWVLTRGKVVSRDERGNPLRAAGTNQDISNSKRLNLEGTDLLKRIEVLIRAAGKRSDTTEQPAEPASSPALLSNRQREVMELVAAGYKSTEIAKRLRITPATVDTHRRDLMRKLDLHSIADLTRYAIQHKLISGQA